MVMLGIALLIAGLVCVAAEAHVPAHGALAVPGAAGIATGAAIIVSGSGGGVLAGLLSAVVLAAVALVLAAVMLRTRAATRRRRIRSGPEALTGRIGVVRSWSERGGKVTLDGGLWAAELECGEDAFAAGDRVVVDYISGLTLLVRRAEEWELARW